MGWRREEGRQRSQLRGRRSQLKMMRAWGRVEAVQSRLSEEIQEICGQPDQQDPVIIKRSEITEGGVKDDIQVFL